MVDREPEDRPIADLETTQAVHPDTMPYLIHILRRHLFLGGLFLNTRLFRILSHNVKDSK